MTRAYGWKRPATRRHMAVRLSLAPEDVAALPPSVDLRPGCPEVYDQGNLGSCTANALAGAVEYLLLRQRREGVPTVLSTRPSRLALYWLERSVEGTVTTDAGAVIGDGVGVLTNNGWIPESEWGYDPSVFAAPPVGDFTTDRLTAFTPLPHDLDGIRSKLALGFPVVFGVQVYPQIETAPEGAIALPAGGDASIGGHAMMLVGYDDAARVFRVRNSWGAGWGDAGYGTIPYDYVCNLVLCDELYSLEAVRPCDV